MQKLLRKEDRPLNRDPRIPGVETDAYWTNDSANDPAESDEALERFIEDERISFREEWFLYLEDWEP